ncbi:hypothetical protein ACLOJK_022424 [Asimina triloba]
MEEVVCHLTLGGLSMGTHGSISLRRGRDGTCGDLRANHVFLFFGRIRTWQSEALWDNRRSDNWKRLAADTESVESNGSDDLGAKLARLMERMDFYDVRHEEMTAKLESLSDEVAVLKRAFLESGGRSEGRKTKVPNHSPYSGVRNAKELENFFFDME